MNAVWWNPHGYTCRHIRNEWTVFPFRKAIFDFRLYSRRPATLQLDTHLFLQSDRHFITDKGTIPVCLRSILPHDAYELAFCFHDSPHQRNDEQHGGYWTSSKLAGPYEFESCSRRDADDYLHAAMLCDTEMVFDPSSGEHVARRRQHATRAMAYAVWCAVRALGPRW